MPTNKKPLPVLYQPYMIRHYIVTLVHKFWVCYFILCFCLSMLRRAIVHDFSKFYGVEAKLFAEHLKRLKDTPFGSPEYEEMLKDLRPALDRHYKLNSHHPQHYPNGMHDFTLLDLVEFFCDCKAACKRQSTGDIDRSIDICEKRFQMDHEVAEILHNQVTYDKGKKKCDC